jgi:hypothetical protein
MDELSALVRARVETHRVGRAPLTSLLSLERLLTPLNDHLEEAGSAMPAKAAKAFGSPSS